MLTLRCHSQGKRRPNVRTTPLAQVNMVCDDSPVVSFPKELKGTFYNANTFFTYLVIFVRWCSIHCLLVTLSFPIIPCSVSLSSAHSNSLHRVCKLYANHTKNISLHYLAMLWGDRCVEPPLPSEPGCAIKTKARLMNRMISFNTPCPHGRRSRGRGGGALEFVWDRFFSNLPSTLRYLCISSRPMSRPDIIRNRRACLSLTPHENHFIYCVYFHNVCL